MNLNGLFIIDKPGGPTSHDVVDQIRRQFSLKRAGHLGTLDPLATGVLAICVGKATRLSQFMPGSPKEYSGELRFGFSTTTYDREGVPTSAETPLAGSEETVREAMRQLTGSLNQLPPPFSAKKVGGIPAYRLARRGKPAALAPSRVEVFQFEITKFDVRGIEFRVVTSAGTYVRSLVHDLGQLLKCGAYLESLRRTRSGDFLESHAIPLDQIRREDLIPMENLLESWPRLVVSDADEEKVRHGVKIEGAAEGPFARIFNKRGEFMAVAVTENGWVRPKLVLTSTTSD